MPLPTDPYEFDVEDVSFGEEATDEVVRYDDGPGTHKWPARLSCGLIATASAPLLDYEDTPTNEKVETCLQAVAVLGRAPRKKIRGWNSESIEGKAIILLANWEKTGKVPLAMPKLLEHVQAVYISKYCFCTRASVYPYVVGSKLDRLGIIKETSALEIPLISSFFYERREIDIGGREENADLLSMADLFVRSMLCEILLQTPECVIHRAHSFVLDFLNTRSVFGKRPDEAAKMSYVQEINAVRKAMADRVVTPPTYTDREDRTLEWEVEEGGKKIKEIKCGECNTKMVKVGGCVTIICSRCGMSMCWLCEAPIKEYDHVAKRHRLLYSSCVSVKTALQKEYGVSLCSLKPVILDSSYFSKGYKESSFEVYVMEDGFRFDVKNMYAVAISDK